MYVYENGRVEKCVNSWDEWIISILVERPALDRRDSREIDVETQQKDESG